MMFLPTLRSTDMGTHIIMSCGVAHPSILSPKIIAFRQMHCMAPSGLKSKMRGRYQSTPSGLLHSLKKFWTTQGRRNEVVRDLKWFQQDVAAPKRQINPLIGYKGFALTTCLAADVTRSGCLTHLT